MIEEVLKKHNVPEETITKWVNDGLQVNTEVAYIINAFISECEDLIDELDSLIKEHTSLLENMNEMRNEYTSLLHEQQEIDAIKQAYQDKDSQVGILIDVLGKLVTD